MFKSKSCQDNSHNPDLAESWILSNYESIYRYLYRLCGDPLLAEDLTQETCLKAWRGLIGYEGRSSMKTWLLRIAYHLFVDWQRKGKLAPNYDNDWWDIPDQTGPPDEVAHGRQQAAELYRLVERLDEDRRQVIHLHYYENLSLSETASVLSCPVSTVKYRLRKALNSLKHWISHT